MLYFSLILKESIIYRKIKVIGTEMKYIACKYGLTSVTLQAPEGDQNI
jgi:hypothetical protein